MTSALVVIDMQQGSFTPQTPRHDAAGVVARINLLAQRVRAGGGPVIFVQHDGPPGDPHHPEASGWHLLPDLEVRDGDRFVRKRACDAFLDSGLEELLRSAAIRSLIVTGCATEFCVDTTVRSALARSFCTIVPQDAHTTADRPHLPAVQIIAHHNATWADFISPAGPAKVCAGAEIVLD